MKIKKIFIMLLFAIILTGCGKKEEISNKSEENIYLEDERSVIIDDSSIDPFEDSSEYSLDDFVEDSIENVLNPINVNDFRTNESLYKELDKIMSLDYNFFTKDYNINSDTENFNKAILAFFFDLDFYIKEMNKEKELYQEDGQLNNRTLAEFYRDTQLREGDKTHVSNSNAYPSKYVFYLDTYANLIEERDIRLESLGFNNIESLGFNNVENIDFDFLMSKEATMDLAILLDSFEGIRRDLDVSIFKTVEYIKINRAYQVYNLLMTQALEFANILNDYESGIGDYSYLEDESAMDFFKTHIMCSLEEAAKLKKEIGKVESHLMEISNKITPEVLEREEEEKLLKEYIEKQKEDAAREAELAAEKAEELKILEEWAEEVERKMDAQKTYKINELIVSENNDAELKVTGVEFKEWVNYEMIILIDIEFKNNSESTYHIDYKEFNLYLEDYKINHDNENEFIYDSLGIDIFDYDVEKGETVKGTLIYYIGIKSPFPEEQYSLDYPNFPQFSKGYYSDKILLGN